MSQNFARSTVSVPPSPAVSGTAIGVPVGHGVRFVAGPAFLSPPFADAEPSNSEIVTISAVVNDVLTVVRGAESSTARTIEAGWRIGQGVTAAQYDGVLSSVAAKADAAATTAALAAKADAATTTAALAAKADDAATTAALATKLSTVAAATTYTPIVPTGMTLATAVARAESDAANGVVPARMATVPTIIAPTKGSGVTGTPTVAAGGTGYVVGDQITLTGGTGLSAAILQVATLSGSAVATVTVIRNGSYTAVPGNPVAQGSTTGVGTGATFTMAWSANGQSTSISRQTVAPTDSRFRFTGNGPSNLSASGFYGNSAGNGTHTSWEWSTNSQRLDIPLIGLNSNAILYVDGRQVSATQLVTDASGLQYLYALDFGAVGWRNFRLVGYNLAFGGIRVDGTATVAAPLTTARPLWWTIGDSYTATSFPDNAGTTHIQVMGDILGIDVISDGIGSTGWNSPSGNIPATRITTKLNALVRQVDYVSFDLGLNDAGGSMVTAASAFDAAFAAVAASPSVKVSTKYFAFGPATPVGRTTNLDLVRDMLIARCAANGVTFIDVGDWVNSVNKVIYTDVDNVHPVPLGHKFLGARRAVAIRPYL
jgi:hypothetical protein